MWKRAFDLGVREVIFIFPATENDMENWTTSIHSKECVKENSKKLNKIKSFGIFILTWAAVLSVTSSLPVAVHAAEKRNWELLQHKHESQGQVSVREKVPGTQMKGWGKL